MADTRVSYSQVLAVFDNIAKIYQTAQTPVDGGFSGESTNTVLYGLRYLANTRIAGWTGCADGIAKVFPAAADALANFDSDYRTSPGVTRFLAPIVKNIVLGIQDHEANFDTTYTGFWDWWATNASATPNDKVLGEVVDLMIAANLSVDSDWCVPPEHLILGKIAFTTVGTAIVTPWNDIDPEIYKGHDVELYCIARNVSPDTCSGTFAGVKIETDSINSAEDGATSFTFKALDTMAATDVVDIAKVSGHSMCSLSTASLTGLVNGKVDDEFYVRVKRYRAASF